jgi:polar amino acid transport system substrate-binding protein
MPATKSTGPEQHSNNNGEPHGYAESRCGISRSAFQCDAKQQPQSNSSPKRAQTSTASSTSGQSLDVHTTRLPHVNSIDDLVSLTIGVQQGNTSQPIPGVEVVCQGISVVNIAIAVPLADEGLLRHITAAAGAL